MEKIVGDIWLREGVEGKESVSGNVDSVVSDETSIGSFNKFGAVGDAFVFCCDSSYVFGVVYFFVLFSFICASKSILFIDVEKIPKNIAKIHVLRLLVCSLVYVLHMCYRFLSIER